MLWHHIHLFGLTNLLATPTPAERQQFGRILRTLVANHNTRSRAIILGPWEARQSHIWPALPVLQYATPTPLPFLTLADLRYCYIWSILAQVRLPPAQFFLHPGRTGWDLHYHPQLWSTFLPTILDGYTFSPHLSHTFSVDSAQTIARALRW